MVPIYYKQQKKGVKILIAFICIRKKYIRRLSAVWPQELGYSMSYQVFDC